MNIQVAIKHVKKGDEWRGLNERREMVSTVEEQASPRYHRRFARRKVEMFAPRNGVMFGLGMTVGIG